MPYRTWRLHYTKPDMFRSDFNRFSGKPAMYYDPDAEWKPASYTCRARTEKEALRHGGRFWESGEFGLGSIRMIREKGV